MSEAKSSIWSHPFSIAVFSAVLGGLISIASAWVLGYIQAREPILQYQSNESQSFEGKDGFTAIYTATVSNIGNKSAEKLRVVVKIPHAKILQEPKLIKNDALEVTFKIQGDAILLESENFNHGMKIGIQCLATSPSALPSKPILFVVSKDNVGEEEEIVKAKLLQVASRNGVILLVLVFGVIVGIIVWILILMDEAERTKTPEFTIDVMVVRQDLLCAKVVSGPTASMEWQDLSPNDTLFSPYINFAELRGLGSGRHTIRKPSFLVAVDAQRESPTQVAINPKTTAS